MINNGTVYLAFFIYMLILYMVARWGDKQNFSERKIFRGVIYSFSLAVYCTSWTYYGAVGTAAKTGWGFLPIYLGPILLFTLGWPLIYKIIKFSKSRNVTSIADFVASLYGKSRRMAVLVTIVAVFASVPYIALQMEAISSSLDAISIDTNSTNVYLRTFIIAVIISFFSIIFGTRKLDVTEHHRGLMIAIAFESVVKLIAFAAVGIFVVYFFYSGPKSVVEAGLQIENIASGPSLTLNFISQVLLAFLVFMCLPRQFHVTVVENENQSDLRISRWIFVVYLIIFSMFVIPVALAGNHWLGTNASADMYVLKLPLLAEKQILALFVLLGGLAAATGMIIISTIALSTMVSNDLLLPLYLILKKYNLPRKTDLQGAVLLSRRVSIVLITLLGYFVYYILEADIPLASFGNLSFLLTVQFAPAILLGLYWKKSTKQAAFFGVVTGVIVWSLFILYPNLIFNDGILTSSNGISAMQNLTSKGSHLAKFFIYSICANVFTHIVISYLMRLNGSSKRSYPLSNSGFRNSEIISIGELKSAVAKIIGKDVASRSYQNFFQGLNIRATDNELVSAPIIHFTERLLSGSIGSSSARTVLTTLLKSKGLAVNDIVGLLNKTTEAIQFQRRLTNATLDSISQGVSVVDKNLRLIAWNKQYEELLNYPQGMLYKGMPISDLIKFNATRGLLGELNINSEIEKRLVYLRKGIPYRHERSFTGEVYLQIEGNPMPDDGYVTTYTDVTHYKRIEKKLIKSEKDIRFYTDNSPALLAYVDNQFILKFANKAYHNFFSSSQNGLIGLNINQIYKQSALKKCKPFLQNALAGIAQSFELELQNINGDNFFVLGTYVPDIDKAKQKVNGVFVIIQDISSRRKAEIELQIAKEGLEKRVQERTQQIVRTNKELEEAKRKAEKANLSKTKFIADASHDLLQPFNAARLFSSLLTERKDEFSDNIKQTVLNLDKSLRSAENLLGALLDIARMDAQGMTVEKTGISLVQIFEDLRNQNLPFANKKNLKLTIRTGDYYTFSDRKLLYRVLQNLTNNAIKYTSHGGILVSCRLQNNKLNIYIIDSGTGLSKDEQEQIFQDFHRLNKDMDGEERGLGLGLSIVERILKLLKHDLTIRSIPDRGTCFKLTLPSVDSRNTISENNDESEIIKSLSQLSVLCIDNEEQILEGMYQLLSNWGHEVKCARDYSEASDIINTGFQPQLILADYHLDRETGIDVIENIFNNYSFKCPVVIITANRTDELKQIVVEKDYKILLKPIKPVMLRNIINQLMQG